MLYFFTKPLDKKSKILYNTRIKRKKSYKEKKMRFTERMLRNCGEEAINELLTREPEIDEKVDELEGNFEEEYQMLLKKYKASYKELLGEHAGREYELAVFNVVGTRNACF